MFFIVAFAALLLSVAFTVFGVRLQKRYPDGAPFLLLGIAYLAQFAVFSMLISAIGLLSGGLLVALGFLIALPPFCVLGAQISQLFGNVITDALYGGTMMSKAPKHYGKARTLHAQGNIDGAIAAYKVYFQEDTATPEPMYQAAMLLIREGRLEEAAGLYRDVMQHNRENIPVWAKAAFTLAQLLELQIKDTEAAEVLYSQIIVRARGTEAARLAANRQMQRSDTAHTSVCE